MPGQAFKVYGKNSVLEALECSNQVSKIWILESALKDQRLKDIEQIARKNKVPVYKVQREKIDRLCEGEKNKPIVAEIAPIKFYEESYLNKEQVKKILIAANIEDPHNLGAIIRTSYAFGCDALVIPSRKSSPITDTVISSSAGSAFKLPLVRVGNLTNCMEKLKKNGFWVYGTDCSEVNVQDYREVKFDEKSVIVLGNEAKGLSDKLKSHCDFLLKIPVKFDSLNVSVATGVILSRLLEDS